MRDPGKKLNRDLQTMELKMEEGRGFAETVASNTKISNSDNDKTSRLLSTGYYSQKRLESIMNLCTFSNITVFVPSEKESLPCKRSDSEGV